MFAVMFDAIKELIAEHADLLDGKVVVDPSSPITVDDNGEFVRTLPDGQSAGSVIAGLLPAGAQDDDPAAAAAERLITAAGFDPVKAGGVSDVLRFELFGDLDPDPLRLAEDELSAWTGFLRVHATVNRKLDTELERAEGLSASSYDVLIRLSRAPKLTDRGRYRLRKATPPHLAGIRQHLLATLSREEQRLLGDIWKRILATGLSRSPSAPAPRRTRPRSDARSRPGSSR